MQFLVHPDSPQCSAFSSDGRFLAVAYGDRVRVWDLSSTEIKYTTMVCGENPFAVTKVLSVSFPPDGMYIITASIDDTVRRWSLRTGALESWVQH